MNNSDNNKKFLEWYIENQHLYRSLSKKVESILREIFEIKGINYHFISSREKDIQSLSKKIDSKQYKIPLNEVTDLAAIRVITYVEEDVQKVCKLIEEHFNIDRENSLDKGAQLATDQVGYKSVHYIATLFDTRIELPEYARFGNMKFEIQVRTILQHAWAEIEHDRNYKFSGVLPIDITRRFNLLSGILESADREFNSIAKEIDNISKTVEQSTEAGELDINIDSTSLLSYLNVKLRKLIDLGLDQTFASVDSKIIAELKHMDISKLNQLDSIMTNEIVNKIIDYGEIHLTSENYAGFLRNVMMIYDVDLYFNKAWENNWGTIDKYSVGLLKTFGVNIDKYIADNSIDIEK